MPSPIFAGMYWYSRGRQGHFQRQILLAIAGDRKLPGGFPVLRAGLGETKLFKMIANQAVFGGRDVASDDLGYSPHAGLLDQILQDGFLHAPAQDAARHDPGVHLQNSAGLSPDDR